MNLMVFGHGPRPNEKTVLKTRCHAVKVRYNDSFSQAAALTINVSV